MIKIFNNTFISEIIGYSISIRALIKTFNKVVLPLPVCPTTNKLIIDEDSSKYANLISGYW